MHPSSILITQVVAAPKVGGTDTAAGHGSDPEFAPEFSSVLAAVSDGEKSPDAIPSFSNSTFDQGSEAHRVPRTLGTAQLSQALTAAQDGEALAVNTASAGSFEVSVDAVQADGTTSVPLPGDTPVASLKPSSESTHAPSAVGWSSRLGAPIAQTETAIPPQRPNNVPTLQADQIRKGQPAEASPILHSKAIDHRTVTDGAARSALERTGLLAVPASDSARQPQEALRTTATQTPPSVTTQETLSDPILKAAQPEQKGESAAQRPVTQTVAAANPATANDVPSLLNARSTPAAGATDHSQSLNGVNAAATGSERRTDTSVLTPGTVGAAPSTVNSTHAFAAAEASAPGREALARHGRGESAALSKTIEPPVSRTKTPPPPAAQSGMPSPTQSSSALTDTQTKSVTGPIDEMPFATHSVSTSSPAGSAGPTTVNSAITAQQVASQVSAALPRADGLIITPSSTELRLDPPDLGRLHIVVTDGPQGLNVSITSERGDTSELMRRHVELLKQELEREGVGDATFEFHQQGSGTPSERQELDETDALFDTDEHADEVQTSNPENVTSQQAPSGRLDLRL